MNDPFYIFYQSAMIFSLVVSLFVVALSWRHRRANGAKAMVALAIGTFVWTLGFLLEANSITLDRQLFFCNIGYLGSMSVPVAWFVFALNYTSGRKLLIGWKIVPFCVVPLITTVLIWTNSLHHLMWYDEYLTTSGAFTVTAKTYGWFFWVAVSYNYILILTGAVFLVRRLFVGTSIYSRQAISLVMAVSLPLIWNIHFVMNILPIPHKDLTPVMFAVSGLIIALGLLRFQIFRSIPFARRFLIQQLHDGILVFDINNHILEANPAVLQLLGAANDREVIGKDAGEFSLLSPVLEQLSQKRFGITELPLDVTREERIFELETIPMKEEDGETVGWLAIFRDITERKKMQAQLIAQDRLSSIGELTSGIAHELNNPLSSVIGYSELVLRRELPADVKEDMHTISKEAERASKIVDNLLTFARGQPEDKSLVNINVTIEKTMELRSHEQKLKNIQTTMHLAPELPNVLGDEFQLRQVFLNIIINAEFFMLEAHGKGTLTIETEERGDFVRISFSDDGPGIPEENTEHLFDPFFTTKEVGKGTGLGLSICHGIISEHNGRIWVESKPGEGADFIIELPAY